MIIRRAHIVDFAVSSEEIDDISVFWEMIDVTQHLKIEDIPTAMLMVKIITTIYKSTQHLGILLNDSNINNLQQSVNDHCDQFIYIQKENNSKIHKINAIIRTVTGKRGTILSTKTTEVKLLNMFSQFLMQKMKHPQHRATRYLREVTLLSPSIQLSLTLKFDIGSKELDKNEYQNAVLSIKTIKSSFGIETVDTEG